jgi:hypothetical protein
VRPELHPSSAKTKNKPTTKIPYHNGEELTTEQFWVSYLRAGAWDYIGVLQNNLRCGWRGQETSHMHSLTLFTQNSSPVFNLERV